MKRIHVINGYGVFKVLIFMQLFLCFESSVMAQNYGKVDTVFYDLDWKVAPMEDFATYKRVIFTSNDTSKFKNKYRDYYTATKTLQGEGGFSSLELNDVQKSVYDGKCERYFKNGNLLDRKYYNGGKLNGEYTSFYENGYLEKKCTYIDGSLDGMCSKFDKDENYCEQTVYSLGKPKFEYYTRSNQRGLCSRYYISDNKPYFEVPSLSEMSKKDMNGFYNIDKNGVVVRLSIAPCTSHGSFLELKVNVRNFRLESVDFDPKKMVVEYIDIVKTKSKIKEPVADGSGKYESKYIEKIKKVDTLRMNPLSFEEFYKRESRKESVKLGIYAFFSGLSNVAASYSTTNTTVNTHYNGNTTANGYASAYGNGTIANAYFGGRSDTNGNINTTISSTTYDPYRAYQLNMATRNEMQNYRYDFESSMEKENQEYLVPVSIPSANFTFGHIYVRFMDFSRMRVTIYINDTPYVFEFAKAGTQNNKK